MFIVWGTKVVRKKLGRVADYCPSCCDASPFVLREVRRVSHVYYIPMGRGEVVAHEIVCETCKMDLLVPISRYRSVLNQRDAVMDDLVRETNPGLYDEMVERLGRLERVEGGAATAEERREALIEPFAAVAPKAEARARSAHIDWPTGLSLLTVMFLPWGFVVAAFDRPGGTNDFLLGVGIALAVASLFSLFYFAATGVSRYIRRDLVPTLVRNLRPLSPTLDELEGIVAEMKAHKLVLGKKLDPGRLHELISQSSSD